MSNEKPLMPNADLEKLAQGIKGITKEKQFSVHERLVYVRGHYERDRAALVAQVEALTQRCATLEAIVAEYYEKENALWREAVESEGSGNE